MSTMQLPPLPTYEQVKPAAIALTNYYQLYKNYFFGAQLPSDFPRSIAQKFPNKSYKYELKNAVKTQKDVVENMVATQEKYLDDYYSLYMHYEFETALPANFSEQIIKEFPSVEYKERLKSAIAKLQNDIIGEQD